MKERNLAQEVIFTKYLVQKYLLLKACNKKSTTVTLLYNFNIKLPRKYVKFKIGNEVVAS